MKKREIVLSVALLVTIILGMFVYTYLAQQKLVVAPEVPTTPTPVANNYGITQIDATHFYIDGVHTIVGEISLPTPCDLLTYQSSVAESMPEQITYQFAVINNSDMCAQVVTTQRFRIEATASEMATHKATFMNAFVELNLRQAAPGETPEAFELYQKG